MNEPTAQPKPPTAMAGEIAVIVMCSAVLARVSVRASMAPVVNSRKQESDVLIRINILLLEGPIKVLSCFVIASTLSRAIYRKRDQRASIISSCCGAGRGCREEV